MQTAMTIYRFCLLGNRSIRTAVAIKKIARTQKRSAESEIRKCVQRSAEEHLVSNYIYIYIYIYTSPCIEIYIYISPCI